MKAVLVMWIVGLTPIEYVTNDNTMRVKQVDSYEECLFLKSKLEEFIVEEDMATDGINYICKRVIN